MPPKKHDAGGRLRRGSGGGVERTDLAKEQLERTQQVSLGHDQVEEESPKNDYPPMLRE